MRHRIFLGHVGEDHEQAASLAAAVERGLADRGVQVVVFNTSDDRHRFPEMPSLGGVGPDHLERVAAYGTRLKDYLASSLGASAAYLLLVTRRSLTKNSGWIAFEAERAAQCRTPFIPCLCEGLTWREVVEASFEDREKTEIEQSRWMPRLNMPWMMARDRVMFQVGEPQDLDRLLTGLKQVVPYAGGEAPNGEQGAAPNGGPAAPLDSSGVVEGPPSVS